MTLHRGPAGTLPERTSLEASIQGFETALNTFLGANPAFTGNPVMVAMQTELTNIHRLLGIANTAHTEPNIRNLQGHIRAFERIIESAEDVIPDRAIRNTFHVNVTSQYNRGWFAWKEGMLPDANDLKSRALGGKVRRRFDKIIDGSHSMGRGVTKTVKNTAIAATVATGIVGTAWVGKQGYDYLTTPPGNVPEVAQTAPTVKNLVDTHFTIQPGTGNAERDSYHGFWQALRNITKSRPGQWVGTDGHIKLEGTKGVNDTITLYADEDGDKEVITINWKNNKGKAGKSIFEQSGENGAIMYRTGDKGVSSRPISLAEMKKMLDDYANY